MKKLYYLLLPLVLFVSTDTSAKPGLKKFFRKCDKFLTEYVNDGKVDYESLVKNPSKLNQLVDILAATSVEKSSKKERKAFYINAYNILVISRVINFYPISSPFEIEGFYDAVLHEVAGEKLSLNQIQEEKLLKEFRDIRVSFALCSGTIGSFPLADYVYKPKNLDKQLNQRIKQLAKDEKYVRVKKRSSRVLFCEAFIRCGKFADPNEIVKRISEHLEEAIPKGYALDYYPANRNLNNFK